MIALDPILIEFYQGNVLAGGLLLGFIGFILKLLTVMSKNNDDNKVLTFLTSWVEAKQSKRRIKKNGKGTQGIS